MIKKNILLHLVHYKYLAITHLQWITANIFMKYSLNFWVPEAVLTVQHFYSGNHFQHYCNPFQILCPLQMLLAMTFLQNYRIHNTHERQKWIFFLYFCMSWLWINSVLKVEIQDELNIQMYLCMHIKAFNLFKQIHNEFHTHSWKELKKTSCQ